MSQHLSSVTHQMRMTEDGLSEDQASLSLSSSYTAAQHANTAGSPGMLTLSGQLNSVSGSEGFHRVLGACPQNFQLSILVVGSFWPLIGSHLFPASCVYRTVLLTFQQGSLTSDLCQTPFSLILDVSLSPPSVVHTADLRRHLCFLVDSLYDSVHI